LDINPGLQNEHKNKHKYNMTVQIANGALSELSANNEIRIVLQRRKRRIPVQASVSGRFEDRNMCLRISVVSQLYADNRATITTPS
jgi:hypothetical protein